METLVVKGWPIEAAFYEDPGAGHCAFVLVEPHSVHDLMRFIHEVHQRDHTHAIVSISFDEDSDDLIKVDFSEASMERDEMREHLRALLKDTITLHDQRELEKQRTERERQLAPASEGKPSGQHKVRKTVRKPRQVRGQH